MNIIDNYNLLTQQQINLLNQCVLSTFYLGRFQSLEDILVSLKVDVIIETGIVTRSIPSELNYAEEYWLQETNRIEKLNINEKSNFENYHNAQKNLSDIRKEKKVWTLMPLRGLYDSCSNVVKLYPEEMMRENNGKCMDELLVSTLAHETMHAYFNRPGHKKYPYAIFVEEPLAEFGMLLYLHECTSSYYSWAYNDVNNKRSCYHYGAALMKQYLNDTNQSCIREYLERYKIDLDYFAMPICSSDNSISLPTRKLASLSSMINLADSSPCIDLVSELINMLNNQVYYETKGNIYLLFGIIYAYHIQSKSHVIYILGCARLPIGQAQRIMDGKVLGITLRNRNMI